MRGFSCSITNKEGTPSSNPRDVPRPVLPQGQHAWPLVLGPPPTTPTPAVGSSCGLSRMAPHRRRLLQSEEGRISCRLVALSVFLRRRVSPLRSVGRVAVRSPSSLLSARLCLGRSGSCSRLSPETVCGGSCRLGPDGTVANGGSSLTQRAQVAAGGLACQGDQVWAHLAIS